MARFDITREPPVAQLLPWVEINNVIFERVELEGKKADYTTEQLKEKAEMKIREFKTEYIVYTDGLTDGSQRNGGAGVTVQDQNGNMLYEECFPAGELCSSFGAESVALLEAFT